MSEWRTVKTSFLCKEKPSLIKACKQINLTVQERGQDIYITDHGIKTYGRSPLVLRSAGEEFVLQGSCPQEQLTTLATKIKKKYSEIVVMKTMSKMGFFKTSRSEKEQVKIVLDSI
jgi:hypothetical protein